MKTLVLIFCLVLLFAACKKTGIGPYKSQGTLTGYDLGYCPTCGGIKITIKGDTTLFYRTNKTLAQLGISESTKFPINVSLNWHKDASGYFIVVDQIKVIE
ncbi:MAG TPA: hypothetical protein VK668_01315 [Mucilaginibacter sp.]|nr:hypothetical protein [Mucilaginibacter sp.]